MQVHEELELDLTSSLAFRNEKNGKEKILMSTIVYIIVRHSGAIIVIITDWLLYENSFS